MHYNHLMKNYKIQFSLAIIGLQHLFCSAWLFADSPSIPFFGEKSLLVIRMDFSDKPGSPATEGEMAILTGKIRQFFQDNSYGKATVKPITFPTIRMPQPLSYYAEKNANGSFIHYQEVRRDALDASRAAGYPPENYDRLLFFTHVSTGPFGNFATGNSAYINDVPQSIGAFIHELGHAFSLPHAHLFGYTDTSMTKGVRDEYGNPFDIMGFGGTGDKLAHHFNIFFKFGLGWITDDDVITASVDGTYRIMQQDAATAHGHRAIRILLPSSAPADYWIEFRQALTDHPFAMNGIEIYRARGDMGSQELLRVIPNPDPKADWYKSPLSMNTTFTDSQYGIKITPLHKVGTVPESVDIAILFNSFSHNH